MPQQSNRAQIKNLSDLTHKICPKILPKVTPVTSMTNIFLKTSEGQLFPGRLKDIFLAAYLFMFSGISRAATHFSITVKKNITGNKLCPEVTLGKKIFLNLLQSCLKYFVNFRPGQIEFIKPDRACKKIAYKTKVCVRLRNSNCFLLFIT